MRQWGLCARWGTCPGEGHFGGRVRFLATWAFAARQVSQPSVGMNASPQSNLFNRSSLIQYFTDLGLVGIADSKTAFAQGMAQWVGFADAMTLYTALEYRAPTDLAAPTSAHATGQDAHCQAARANLTRVHDALVDLVTRSCATTAGAARLKFPAPQSGTALEIAAMYTPFHRFFLSLQREMESRVGPLRASVRASMAGASPELRKLALLDAAFEGIVSERERRLLASVPQLLEKRFKQLRAEYEQALARSGQADDLATWMLPGAWLALFRDELRRVVLDEWDVRLQPVLGLVAAFSNEVKQST
jgi:hypothetical protein